MNRAHAHLASRNFRKAGYANLADLLKVIAKYENLTGFGGVVPILHVHIPNDETGQDYLILPERMVDMGNNIDYHCSTLFQFLDRQVANFIAERREYLQKKVDALRAVITTPAE